MSRINCYLPIKVCITGRLGGAELEQLSETLVRAVSARIAFAEQQIAIGNGGHRQDGVVEIVREGYDSARDDATAGSYSVPSYQSGGQPTVVPLRPGPVRRHRRPWFIRQAVHFHARVGRFFDFVESVIADPSLLSDRVLYMDVYDQLRWVSLWLVQVNEQHTLLQLEEILQARAQQLSRVASNQILAYGMGTAERIRNRLIQMDEDHVVAREIPVIWTHNAHRVTGTGSNVTILPGGWVLFASMVLPKVEEDDVVRYGSEATVSLPLHALDFIVNGESFERLFGVSWNSHLNQFGDQPAELRMLPFYTLRRVHLETLRYLLDRKVALSVDQGSAYFGRLCLLNRSEIDWLPPTARPQAWLLTDDTTLHLDESRREGWWEPNWAGAFIYAVVNATGEQPVRPEVERAGQQEPSETPEQLIDRFTHGINLDEEGLGAYLVGLIRRSPALSHYVQRVLDELGILNRDDVSLAFVESAQSQDLDNLAHSPNGRLLLVRLYDEMTSGNLGGAEVEEAGRVMAALVRSRSLEVVARRLETARGWIFPYRQPGPTVIDGGAPIMAERLADGRIRVRIPVAVGGTNPYRNETQTLPRAVFSSGLILDPDEWIRVKLYDEGGTIVVQPALYLLQISNQGTTKTLESISTVILTVASLGAGSVVASASWGARVLVALDRAAVALSVISIVVNDHRGWIISTFGDTGRFFLRTVEIANALAGVYGIGRLAISSPRIIANLRNGWRNWRASQAYGGLQGDDLRRADDISQGVEQFLNSADEAAAAAEREAASVATGTGTASPSSTTPQPSSPVGAAEPPRVVLYRGTTYQFIRGRSRQIHDLGDGVYMTFDADLAVLYAQERRVLAQATDPGSPGIVLRVEVEPSEMGRVLDFYHNRALRADWETFVARQPGGQVVLRGGPAEMYNGHFQNWLRSRGQRLEDFDVIIGPEYIRGGSQACIRNEATAERLLNRADEWARAHEPVTPSYPDVHAPRVPSE